MTSVDVVPVLEQLVVLHGAPTTVKSDNGSEFVSKKVREWVEDRGIGIRFIEPGSPLAVPGRTGITSLLTASFEMDV